MNVVLATNGEVLVSDSFNNAIRVVTCTGNFRTFAGGSSGFADGQGRNARFHHPNGIDLDVDSSC